jgi:hypothetical protein
MATKYSDAIRIRETKSAYNIQTETADEWKNFIPNEQFDEILQKVIDSVSNKIVDEHRSFWLEGTYGSGKSHAAAVIKHLLCDPIDEIREYIEEEFSAPKYEILKTSLLQLRKNIRLFPVTMYGDCSIAHKDDLSLQIQSHVCNALEEANITIKVKTDYDNYISNIEKNPSIWDMIIAGNAELRSYAPDRKKLIKCLEENNSTLLTLIKDALRNSGLHVRLEQENLCKWFFEVQNELANTTDYKGIFLIWDEFTDVMTSEIGPSLLVNLQDVAEGTQLASNNSYFFHIAHPTALDNLKADERTKTIGRYKFMKYNMEPVSAFKIMSRKFVHEQDPQNKAYKEYHNMTDMYFAQMREVYEKYADSSNNPVETLGDLKSLFPVHPATANLATYYAREAGASSRSVFEFLGSNPAIRDFLEDEAKFANGDMITGDYLWDFVLSEFNSKVTKYGVVTERFNSYRLHVENKGAHYSAVFKAILLLNALNNLANNATVTPSEENIRNMFVGTPIDSEMDEILDWINVQGVVQRSPQGIYEIRFSALDTKEIEVIKEDLLSNNFKYTSQILKYGDTAQKSFEQMLKGVNRPFCFDFYSEDANDSALTNKIESGWKAAKEYSVYMAMMMARTSQELAFLKEFAHQKSNDERFKNVAFLVFDTQIGGQDFDRFIEYQANAICASKHGYAEQTKSHTDNSKAIIGDWVKNIKSGTCTIYLQGDSTTIAARTLASAVNSTISTKIFFHGPESLEILRLKAPYTCWVQQHSKSTADTVLSFNTKEDIVSRCSSGPTKHISLLLQDSVDDNLKFKEDVDINHPLYVVSRFVKAKIDHSDKQNIFNLAEKFADLTKAPYGLFNSHAGYGMLAFALRPYVDKVFDSTGKPINAQRMQEFITDTFKIWESGSNANIHKVDVKFETKEEGSIAKGLIKLFQLDKLRDYKDVTSLTDTRWALRNGFCAEVGYPLWAIKYCDKMQEISIKDKLCKLTDNIITIYTEVGSKNPALLVETDSLITEVKYEYSGLLNKADNNFEIGFKRYLMSNESVKLQDEQYSDALQYIRQHMESGAGSWTEAAVTEQLMKWKLYVNELEAEQRRQEEERKRQEEEEKNKASYGFGGYYPKPVNSEKQTKARTKIQEISSIDEAKSILDALCNLGYESILDTILK